MHWTHVHWDTLLVISAYDCSLCPCIRKRQSSRLHCVALQDAQGENLCQYREFEPSDVADSDDDDTTWHAQKKGCCVVM